MRIARNLRLLLPACALGLSWAVAIHKPAIAQGGPGRPPGTARTIDYAGDVKPILEARCCGTTAMPKAFTGKSIDCFRNCARNSGGRLRNLA